MDIFEAAEAYPSRTLQQEDEEQARPSASANLQAPLIWWNQPVRQHLYATGVTPDCLLIATSKVACSLLSSCFPEKQILGTCVLPEVPMRGNLVHPCLRDRTCCIYSCAEGRLVLVCCQYDVSSQRATAVAKGLLRDMQPKHVLVLGSVSSEQLRSGDSDPSQEPLLYLLSTAQARQAAQQQPVPYLPSGSIASGLPAALLSYCQTRGISAELLVSVDMVPSLQPMALQPLAVAAAALLGRRGTASEQLKAGAQQLVSASCLKSASVQLQSLYGSASQGSDAVFV